LASPSKKVSGVPPESTEPSNPTQVLIPVFTSGSFEKSPVKSLFKAARKGKNKLISVVVDTKMISVKKGGLVKPSKNQ
jgi:hypothetical protein